MRIYHLTCHSEVFALSGTRVTFFKTNLCYLQSWHLVAMTYIKVNYALYKAALPFVCPEPTC